MGDSNLPIEWAVKIDDETIKTSAGVEVMGIDIDLEVDKLDMCTVTFNDTAQNVLKGARHKIGDSMQVDLGYQDKVTTLFLGEAVSLEPMWPEGAPFRLTVRGMDRLHRFKRGSQIRFWEKKKDSAIVKQIADELGLKCKMDATSEEHEYTLQNNLCDAEFLKYLARRNHYELFVLDNELNFVKPAAGGSTEVTLKCGQEVADLRMRLNALGQVGEVIVRGWDVFQKKEIVGEANDLAKALLGGTANQFLTGTGRSRGNPDIKPGATVKLEQFGDYSGSYYVVASRHHIGQQGYITDFDFCSNTDGKGE
jgi:phage protein D